MADEDDGSGRSWRGFGLGAIRKGVGALKHVGSAALEALHDEDGEQAEPERAKEAQVMHKGPRRVPHVRGVRDKAGDVREDPEGTAQADEEDWGRLSRGQQPAVGALSDDPQHTR